MKISGFLEEKTLDELIKSLISKDFMRTGEIIESIEIFDSRNFIRQISEILPSLNLDTENIIKIRAFIGEIDYRISQGADERIQLSALLAMIIENVQS
jgi:replication factor C small subunit